MRDTAVGSPAAGEDDKGRRKRRSGEGRERREEREKIYKLPIKKRRRQKDRGFGPVASSFVFCWSGRPHARRASRDLRTSE